ncbi:MAG: hypothetical protein ABIJ56_24080 [Pseudomonadota bacterium]
MMLPVCVGLMQVCVGYGCSGYWSMSEDAGGEPDAVDDGGGEGGDTLDPDDEEPDGAEAADGDAAASDTDGDESPTPDAVDAAEEETVEIFTCTPPSASSPVLDGVLVYDPADPHPGDTVTVIVRSRELDRPEAPPMVLDELSQAGTRAWNVNAMAGGKALYYYAIPDVEPGDHCLAGKIGGSDEISGKFTVTPRPPPPARCHGGIFKVTTNHLWTCDEQPEWGNVIRIEVVDASGAPMPAIPIRIGWPDTTERPIYNDTDPPEPSEIPGVVETGGDGVFPGFNSWPINVNGYMVFNLSVDGCASDTATEITTGWWETDNDGCRFCEESTTHRNVWGHWSTTVVFELDTSTDLACVVPSDHAGQQGCSISHIHHAPDHTACYSVVE